MASNLTKGNRFYDIMTRTDSDLYDILSGMTGLKIGDQESEILYIQDSGTKKEGYCYIDRNDRNAYRCIRETNSTSNTTDNFDCVSNISLLNRIRDNIGSGKYNGPGVYYIGTKANTTASDLKWFVFEADWEGQLLSEIIFDITEYQNRCTTSQIIFTNYFYVEEDYVHSVNASIFTRGSSSYIDKLYYKIIKGKISIAICTNSMAFYFSRISIRSRENELNSNHSSFSNVKLEFYTEKDYQAKYSGLTYLPFVYNNLAP